jgi:hypothetical protein
MTFSDEGNASSTVEELINFEKNTLMANIIMDIQARQKVKYDLAEVTNVHTFLTSLRALSEKEAYEKSLQAEPRQKT